jgi:hypothetical protein
MITILLGVLGCYILAAISVHLFRRWSRNRSRQQRHFILLADNNQQTMEWYIRSLHRLERKSGTPVKITVVDKGSTDETMAIVDRFPKSGIHVEKAVLPASVRDGTNETGKFRKLPIRRRIGMRPVEPLHLMWMLQAEGVVTARDHAVLVDLRNPADLSKLPL